MIEHNINNKEIPVSIVMSVYDEPEEILRESINSVLAQTYDNFELIIVNDNPSKKENNKILEEYERNDSRIKFIRNLENIGLAMSLNKGIQLSKYEIIVRFDADDVCYSDRIERQLTYYLENNCNFLFTKYTKINENGKIIESDVGYYSINKLIEDMPYENLVHHPTAMFRKKDFLDLRGYNPYPVSQDYDLWLRAIKHGLKFEIMDYSSIYYRLQRNSISSKKRMMQAYTTLYIRRYFMYEFDEEHYRNYLKKHKVMVDGSNDKFVEDIDRFAQLKEYQGVRKYISLVSLFLKQPYYRIRLIEKVKKKLGVNP